MPNRVRAGLARIALVLAVVLLTSLPGGVAWAGGPTSVVLVSPQSERAAALHNGDTDYQRLRELLGGEGPVTADPARPEAPVRSSYVTATWLVHDVSIWRIDRILLDATDGPWVVTQILGPGEVVSDGMFPGGTGGPGAVWHRPTDGEALRSLLAGLGLTGAAPAAAAPVVAAGAPPAGQATPDGTAWWWALGGLVVGAGAAALGPHVTRAVTRRREPTTV